jgi:hypothetical protein
MPPARDDRPWLVKLLDPEGAATISPLAVLAVAVVHLGRGTKAEVLAEQAAILDARL